MVWTRVIFNIALTGDTFWHLRYFVCSLIERSDAQFRSVTNGCTSEAISQIGQFARRHRDRVVEVLDVSPSPATALSLNLNTAWHGIALHAEIEGFSATVIRPSPQTRRGWRVIAEADRLADLVAALARRNSALSRSSIPSARDVKPVESGRCTFWMIAEGNSTDAAWMTGATNGVGLG